MLLRFETHQPVPDGVVQERSCRRWACPSLNRSPKNQPTSEVLKNAPDKTQRPDQMSATESWLILDDIGQTSLSPDRAIPISDSRLSDANLQIMPQGTYILVFWFGISIIG